ncbi:protein of unknown function [Thauera humireducens]|nr:protein of unknown function [Thauera humireducens]
MSLIAADSPAGPPPTISTSNSIDSRMVRYSFGGILTWAIMTPDAKSKKRLGKHCFAEPERFESLRGEGDEI